MNKRLRVLQNSVRELSTDMARTNRFIEEDLGPKVKFDLFFSEK